MKFLALLILISVNCFATPVETISRLQKLYPSQSREFLEQRLNSATTTFDRLRDFPPYFYEAIDRTLKLPERKGFCAGDPHYENFGFLFAPTPFFTINDLDDSAPCNLNADALRLLVGDRLIFPDLDIQKWIKNYEAGVAGGNRELPEELKTLLQTSRERGNELPKKFLRAWEARSCTDDLKPATDGETQYLKTLSRNGTLVFACTRTKLTGGSAGLRRLIGFYLSPEVRVIEYKPLVTPAPLYGQMISYSERNSQYSLALKYFLRDLPEYFAVKIGNHLHQRRPLIAGNVAVELKDGKKREIAYYQAFVLGQLHKGNASFLKELDWKNYSDALIGVFEHEFAR